MSVESEADGARDAGIHGSQNVFPAGKLDLKKLGHSWCTFLLPYLEQDAVASRFDMSKSWNDATGNDEIAESALVLFRCASSPFQIVGGSDYCGITAAHKEACLLAMVEVRHWDPEYL